MEDCELSNKLVVTLCELNQWALDFQGNYERICKSIHVSKSYGSTYRLGPELEISGYNCQDHFYEMDTINHSYEVLAKILANKEFYSIVLDIGLALLHNGVRYNCRAVCLNGEIICIRPKTKMANDGAYHEERWFVGWKKSIMEDWIVPDVIFKVMNKNTVPIGVCLLQFKDVNMGIEMCEELFVPNSLHNILALNGADIICNGNGSHFRIGKINKRFSLVSDASGKTGCVYLYGNLQGCDGSIMYFDGGSFVASSGEIISMNKRFTINSGCLVLKETVDIDEVRSRKASVVSWAKAASESEVLPKIIIPYYLCKKVVEETDEVPKLSDEIKSANNKEMDELLGAPVCYLWDYLRRSGASGFFVPLSGGADSSVVACLVYYMCHELIKAINSPESEEILQDLRRIVNDKDFFPKSAEEISHKILYTAYMGSANSSQSTRMRAKKLAAFSMSNHYDVDINKIYDSFIETVQSSMNITPKYKQDGGSINEDLSLQNIQARTRMVMSYFISQLAPLINKGASTTAPLLVLGTANADECVRGYFTKYDCSSGDLGPIGNLGKKHINKILHYFGDFFKQDIFHEIASVPPTAELQPLKDGRICQKDEEDMGFTYPELDRMRYLRNECYYGPLSMFNILRIEWSKPHLLSSATLSALSIQEISDKVKRFFRLYSQNRHKAIILPPSIHMSNSAIDGRHFDLRPFLYNVYWVWQFKCIDSVAGYKN